MFVVDKDQVPPEGSRCRVHPDWPAEIICKKCGDFCCRGCFVEVLPEVYYCTRCDPPAVPASRGERFRSHMLDSMLLGIPTLPILMSAIVGQEAEEVAVLGTVVGTALLLVLLAVNGYLVQRHGQSVGKRVGGLQVVDLDGKQASLGRVVVLRNAPLWLAAVAAGLIGFSWLVVIVDALVIFGDDKRCLHDYIAGTRVVKLPQTSSRASSP